MLFRDTSLITEFGNDATIPANISIEIPLPIPFFVIFSPSHTKNAVPAIDTSSVIQIGDTKVNPSGRMMATQIVSKIERSIYKVPTILIKLNTDILPPWTRYDIHYC